MFKNSLKQNHFTFARLNNYKLFRLLAAFSLKLSDLIHMAIRKGRNDRGDPSLANFKKESQGSYDLTRKSTKQEKKGKNPRLVLPATMLGHGPHALRELEDRSFSNPSNHSGVNSFQELGLLIRIMRTLYLPSHSWREGSEFSHF